MRILLVRPWIHDFSAYDLWIQPLGLLYLGGVLAQEGFNLDYVDCLDSRFDVRADGRAKFAKEVINTPDPLKGIKRHYGRFGITPSDLHQQLSGRPEAGRHSNYFRHDLLVPWCTGNHPALATGF